MSFEEPINAAMSETPGRSVFGWEISRRQFVVVVGSSAAAIAVAWGYGVSATDSPPAKSAPWAVRVVRAGRGARLTANGSPAFHAALGPSVFSGQADRAAANRAINSTLAVASVASLSGHTGNHADAHTDSHDGGGSSPTTPYPQPGNLTWGDVVVLEVEVQNTASLPSLFSPGQLRLKLASGPTITPQDASRGPAPIAAGAVELLWVSYLAPSDAVDFSVQFTDPRRDAQLALRVPGLITAKA
jgi:hypothetical protein